MIYKLHVAHKTTTKSGPDRYMPMYVWPAAGLQLAQFSPTVAVQIIDSTIWYAT